MTQMALTLVESDKLIDLSTCLERLVSVVGDAPFYQFIDADEIRRDSSMFQTTMDIIEATKNTPTVSIVGDAHCHSWLSKLYFCPHLANRVIFISAIDSSEAIAKYQKPIYLRGNIKCSLDQGTEECMGMVQKVIDDWK